LWVGLNRIRREAGRVSKERTRREAGRCDGRAGAALGVKPVLRICIPANFRDSGHFCS
jgi:hypothetical protein